MNDPRLVSLNHRLRNIAAQEGVPPQRVRNRYVFQRVLARLARDSRWVLKGGFSLELRLGLAAPTTKDLDLLLTDAASLTAPDLQDLLDEALDIDLGDEFTFRVRSGPRTSCRPRGGSSSRCSWPAAPFETVTIDVPCDWHPRDSHRLRSHGGRRRRDRIDHRGHAANAGRIVLRLQTVPPRRRDLRSDHPQYAER